MRHRRQKAPNAAHRQLRLEALERRRVLHAAGVISGSVYIDTNDNGTRDGAESGVPGIVINLSQTDAADSSADLSVITDDDGLYTFDELLPGTYRIVKDHAEAMIDMGSSVDSTLDDVVLADDAVLEANNFVEQGLRAEYIDISWFFSSRPPMQQKFRETIATGEEQAGNMDLAAAIRNGGSDAPEVGNSAPLAIDDLYSTARDEALEIGAGNGVLANDTDADGDSVTASLVGQATDGVVVLNSDGSFTYTPDTGFAGTDSFTYRARDGAASSSLATVVINVSNNNQTPAASDDEYSVGENSVLSIGEAQSVLTNDTDPDGDALNALIGQQPANGTVSLAADGTFTYTPNSGFSGEDSFTYRANDGSASSTEATVSITVTPAGTTDGLFDSVTPGSFESSGLLGERTDLVPGAPAVTRDHVDGDIDYSGYSNPPTYGPHHGFDPNGVDVNPGITPRPTGVYTTEQPEEDLIHNLEHGHVWISYNPSLLDAADLQDLEELVRNGSPNGDGAGVGVILTPRAANTSMLALASWARLQTLEEYDPDAIRDFVNTNRGQAPEGFITP